MDKTATDLLKAIHEIETQRDMEEISNKAYAVLRRTWMVEVEKLLADSKLTMEKAA